MQEIMYYPESATINQQKFNLTADECFHKSALTEYKIQRRFVFIKPNKTSPENNKTITKNFIKIVGFSFF